MKEEETTLKKTRTLIILAFITTIQGERANHTTITLRADLSDAAWDVR